MMHVQPGRARVFVVALSLAALAVAVFAPAVRNGFITLDDETYLYDNPQVLRGLDSRTALWAFRSRENANWYPLTRLTHLADVSLFGLWPGGHHLASVAWHAAAAVLLLLVLRSLTGALWRSAAVAALFAVHPLQVESVAWASERSNVLAGFFFGLTLLLWARYARRPGRRRYGAAALSLALGLMCKPVLVTLPLLLLLLDFWPLGRIGRRGWPGIAAPRLVLEKIPLLALSAIASAVTISTQGEAGALQQFESAPLGLRFGNAALSYAAYLGKMLWPARLAVYYPHPGRGLDVSHALLAALLLAGLTALALSARRRPWLATGWLWYLGTLVPMIGVVQVGGQALADRYAYLPSVGIFLASVWMLEETLRALRAPLRLGIAASVAVAVVAGFGAATSAQLRLWRESRGLYEHALAATRPNALIIANLGRVMAEEGRAAEALPFLESAVRLAPRDAKARDALGHALSLAGRPAEAVEQFRAAVALAPRFVQGRSNLGIALAWNGRLSEAGEELRQALRLDPGYAEAHNNLGKVEDQLGRGEEAIASFRRALELKPSLLAARFNLGSALLKAGRAGEAAVAFEEVLRISPGNTRARALLETARAAGGGGEDSPQ
jgi:tetratricopeptide (TPR) repeat protein